MSTKGVPREPYWTEAEISFLRENYIEMPIATIADHLGRSYEAVRRKAAKVGAQRQTWGEKFSPTEDDLLRERYASASMSEMTALTSRHPNSIRHRARMLGMVNYEQVKRSTIASGIRHDYFSRIDSPIKAYALGILATDGTVASAGNGISLKLGYKDAGLVEMVRDEISPHSIVHAYTIPPLPGYTKERKVAHLAVSSAQIKADLRMYGVVPRKTFILQWPGLLERHLAAPFILGCFDGDGTLASHGQAWQWRWALYSASEPFLADARQVIREHTGLDLIQATSRRGLHEIRLNGARRIRLLDSWLHADVQGLTRKRVQAAQAQ